jgi:hypothetical protein
VSSITVQVYELEMWEEQWLDMHRDHSELDGGEENGEGVLLGELSDYDEEEDEKGEGEGAEHLLMCCGEKRPRGKEKTKISS